VDVSETVNAFSNDVVCRAVSGKFFREEGRNRLFRELIEMNTSMFGGFSLLEDYYPWVARSWLTSWLVRGKAREGHKRWDDLLEKIITDHESTRRSSSSDKQDGALSEQPQDESDFIDVLLSVQQEYGISRDHIKAILVDMFAAGTDTSSLVLEFAMAELMRNPDLMTKLQTEVRNNTPEGQEMVAEENLATMSYLRAVVKETLRLHPPAPLLVPHLSTADCEVLDGYTVPAGTRVIVNAWAIGRDPESWEKPEEFMPERFVVVDGGIDFKGNDFQFLPFGAGRRICPGLNFGLATVEIMLANLVYCFDWELPDGMEEEDIDMTEVFGVTIHPKEKLHLVPKPRGPAAEFL
jgi:cytochrome P450